MRDIIIDFIGAMAIALFAVCFFTNAVTDNYNVWALMARFGGAV